MNILIVSATKAEVQPLLDEWDYRSENEILYVSKSIEVLPPDILISGPGMINTMYHLTKLLSQRKYDLVINVGIGGSFDHSLGLGEIVCVESDCFSELGAEDESQFISVFEMGLIALDEFPFVNGFLYAPYFTSNDLRKVKAITVNQVHGNEKSIDTIIARLHPDVESMEGAAVFFVSLMERIACMQFRAISNYVEKRNKEAWKIPVAVKNLNHFLIDGIRKNHFKIY